MRMAVTAFVALWGLSVLVAGAQRRDVFVLTRDHPAVAYSSGPVDNAVSRANARLASGDAALRFDEGSGYLASVLALFDLPVESQTLVFSPTSFQAPLIHMHNPRALFYGDAVSVGWVRGGDVLEISVQDPRQGSVFYTLAQNRAAAPTFVRNDECLACHLSWDTLGVPGLMTTSMYPLPDDPNAYASGFTTVQGSPLTERWGGWWVTGNTGGVSHMGNVPVLAADKGRAIPNPKRPLASVQGLFDLTGYPAPHSDVVALLVLAHHTRMANMITRLGWEARVAEAAPSPDASARVVEAARDAVDYMLFVDEAPLPAGIASGSGFAERFAARGPKDAQGRSLRDFDLRTRLFKHPLSYLIYGEAFEALPPAAKAAVYDRLGAVLSGRERGKAYAHLTPAVRRTLAEILRETKPGVPDSIQSPATAPAPPGAGGRPETKGR